MTGVEPVSRGATSQHFTIKLQPPLSIYAYLQSNMVEVGFEPTTFKLWAWRDNPFSTPPVNYTPTRIRT